jgi:hypothetical protein
MVALAVMIIMLSLFIIGLLVTALAGNDLIQWKRLVASWWLGSLIGGFVGFFLLLIVGPIYLALVRSFLSAVGFQNVVRPEVVLTGLLVSCTVIGGFSVWMMKGRERNSDGDGK